MKCSRASRRRFFCIELLMRITELPEPEVKKRLRFQSILVGMVFFAIFYLGNGVIQSTDCQYVIPTALSLLNEGGLDVDKFFAKPDSPYKPSDWHLEVIEGRYYNLYPIGQVLIAIPVVFVANKIAGFGYQSELSSYQQLELIMGCVFAAATCVVMFLVASLSLDTLRALLLTAIFGLGSSVWSTVSCGFWQHGPSMFLLALVLYILLLAKERPQLIQYVGIPLALSYVMRPTNALPIAVFTLYVWWKYRECFLRYLLLCSIVAVPFVLFNVLMYHSLLSQYYTPGSAGITREVPRAILGMLVSPSRGLFVFSPVLLFALYGIVLKLKLRRFEALDGCILIIPIGHLFGVALSNPMWWGGWSFGPRLMSDVTPFLAYFIILVLEDSWNWKRAKAGFMWTALALTLAFSSFVHFAGATSPHGWSWNYLPTNVDRDTARLWDWNDSQALRALKIWLAN